MKPTQKICVLGGCGMMGRVIVNCLLQQDSSAQVTVADRRAPSVALSPQVRFVKVDLLNHQTLVRQLRGHAIVINSTSHHFNLPVMLAALKAGVHYLDLGGLFYFTRRQLKLDPTFRKHGLLAILGMGCAPGIANLLTKWATEGMDRVEEIHIKIGDQSWNPPSSELPYAIGTIREELTWKPAIYHKGRLCFTEPRSGTEWFLFPKPVGKQKIFRTIHSEMATLPMNFPGVKEASFKIGFSNEIIRAALRSPSLQQQPSGESNTSSPHDSEVTVALVHGYKKNRCITRMASYISFSKEDHCAGDWNTAWPPAIVARMIATGEISEKGVFPPELVIPLKPVLERLRKAGFRLMCREIK